MLNYKVGFIGSGNMAHAIMKGIVDSRTVAPELSLIHISEPTRPY